MPVKATVIICVSRVDGSISNKECSGKKDDTLMRYFFVGNI